jgi:hypothetical protein
MPAAEEKSVEQHWDIASALCDVVGITLYLSQLRQNCKASNPVKST